MKLTEDSVEKLLQIVATANTIGINALIIEKDLIRGQSEDSTVLLIEKDYVPVLDFDSIGISRVKILNNRANLIAKDGKVIPTIEAKIKQKDSGEQTVVSLMLKDKRTAVEFKCADPAYIKAPKNLKSPTAYSFDITEESVEFMGKTNSAMSHKNIAFELSDGVIIFKLTDVEGDSLTHIVATQVKIEDGESDSFFFKFNRKILQLLKLALKDTPTVQINLTKRGILNLKINNMNVYMIQDI